MKAGAAPGMRLKNSRGSTVVSSDKLPQEIRNSDMVVVSPGIRPEHPIFDYAAKRGLPLIGETGLGAMINRAPVIE